MNYYDQTMMTAAGIASRVRHMTQVQRTIAAAYFFGVLAGLAGAKLVTQDIDTIEKKLLMLFELPVNSFAEITHGNDEGQPR